VSERDGDQEGGIDDSWPVFRITPEPAEEELAAITSAVMALSRSWKTRAGDEKPPEDRWHAAGRREALRSPLKQGRRGVLT
jgi:hypothetical protein